jgi:peptidoglycan/LPS O-acetylase OafA/YrhL
MTGAKPQVKNSRSQRLDWLDPLKAFALLAILLNHLIEEFGRGPWFTNPSSNWPSLAERLRNIYPQQYDFPVSLVQFLGWLGDSGPGVFIFASGFGLTWAALNRPETGFKFKDFYTKRLLRIFPLYITIHVLILAGSLVVPGSEYTLASPYTLLSLLGLRFTDSLFFAFNPSWWFIWLILQLYLVFPLLYLAMKRFGYKRFLIAALTFTFISRFLGLEGIRYSQSLYYWMTGIFFGTRLAEFAVGMALASWLLYSDQTVLNKFSGLGKILGLSTGVYVLGIICSFFWYTTIVSNLLVTLGLSGLFYCLWEGWVRKSRWSTGTVTWIGVYAYPVYLIHQTPLIWTEHINGDTHHLMAAILVLALSFPIGWGISRLVDSIIKNWKRLIEIYPVYLITFVGAIGVLLAIAIVEPMLWEPIKQRSFSLILGGCAALIFLAELADKKNTSVAGFGLRWAAIMAAVLTLFVMPERYGFPAFSLGVFFGLGAILFRLVMGTKLKAVLSSGIMLVGLVLILEMFLARFTPLEAGRWGEYPALQRHPTRVYSLKPNLSVRLKYNNYDYILKTNALGLPSPEVSTEEPPNDTNRILVIGDAFSMPEGLEYENAYPALLEKRLNENLNGKKKVEVVNAGVTGYGPVEQLPQLEELLPELKPDFVVYQFFINEFQEAHIEPEQRLKSIGLLPSHNLFREQVLETMQIREHFERLKSRLMEMVSGEPSAYRYRKSLLSFYEVGENDLYQEERLSKVKGYLQRMQSACNRHGAEMVIYYVPGAVEVSDSSQIAYYPWDQKIRDRSKFDMDLPLSNLRKLSGEMGLSVVDLTPKLKSYPDQPVYFPRSWHWNAKGHEVVASTIAKDLLLRGIFK